MSGTGWTSVMAEKNQRIEDLESALVEIVINVDPFERVDGLWAMEGYGYDIVRLSKVTSAVLNSLKDRIDG